MKQSEINKMLNFIVIYWGWAEALILSPIEWFHTIDMIWHFIITNRPSSSQGFTASHPLEGPIGDTHYTEEFFEKPNRPATPIRSGTASGSRSNKPHPPEVGYGFRILVHVYLKKIHGMKKITYIIHIMNFIINNLGGKLRFREKS